GREASGDASSDASAGDAAGTDACAPEICNGADDDCDGVADDGACGPGEIVAIHRLSCVRTTSVAAVGLAANGRIVVSGNAEGVLVLDGLTPVGTISSGAARMFALALRGNALEAGVRIDASTRSS